MNHTCEDGRIDFPGLSIKTPLIGNPLAACSCPESCPRPPPHQCLPSPLPVHTFSIHLLMSRIISQATCLLGFSASFSMPEGSQAGRGAPMGGGEEVGDMGTMPEGSQAGRGAPTWGCER